MAIGITNADHQELGIFTRVSFFVQFRFLGLCGRVFLCHFPSTSESDRPDSIKCCNLHHYNDNRCIFCGANGGFAS